MSRNTGRYIIMKLPRNGEGGFAIGYASSEAEAKNTVTLLQEETSLPPSPSAFTYGYTRNHRGEIR
jgi:hypothetical protein